MARTNGATNCRRTGAPRDPSEEDLGGQTGAGGQSAGESGAPDQAKPKDKDQYNFTDPQSRIMPGANGMTQGCSAQAAGESRKAGVSAK
jgi:hypothetical protein